MKKLLPILVIVMLFVAGGTTYYAYDVYKSNTSVEDQSIVVQSTLDNIEDKAKQDIAQNSIDEETKKEINRIKNRIEEADRTDSLEEFIEVITKFGNINYDLNDDLELNIMITFARMRVATMEDVIVVDDPSYARKVPTEESSVGKLVRLTHPNYNGRLAERITKIVTYYYTREEWVKEYNNVNGIKMQQIKIGMSERDVVDLTEWGRPLSINKTETAYGTSEQWVYPNYNYLYFENAILTNISTSN